MDRLTLFGEPEPDGSAAPLAVVGILWTPYRPKIPAKCDRCVLELMARAGDAPIAASARYRRRTATTDDLLCYEHARAQRVDDGLPEYRAPRA